MRKILITVLLIIATTNVAFAAKVLDNAESSSLTSGQEATLGSQIQTEFTFDADVTFNSLPSGSYGAQNMLNRWVSLSGGRSVIWSYRNVANVPGFSLFVSSDGTANDHLRVNHTLPSTGTYNLKVNWKDGEAEFFVNDASIGTDAGAITSIYNTTSPFKFGNGSDPLVGSLSDFDIYDEVIESSGTTGNPPENQQGPGYTELNGELYVFGGSSDGAGATINNHSYRYTPSTQTWTRLADMPSARWHPAVQSVDGKIYIIGGKTGTGSTVSNQVWEYDPTLDTYITKATMPTSRSHAMSAVVDDIIYVMGGYNGSTFNMVKVEAYNPATNSWSTKADMPTGRGDIDKAGVVDGLIYAIGGFNGASLATDVVEVYNPATNSWATGFSPMPTKRDSMGIGVWGNFIIALGGYDRSVRLQTVEMYDTTNDSWTTLDDLAQNKENPAVIVSGDELHISHGGGVNLLEVIELEEPSSATIVEVITESHILTFELVGSAWVLTDIEAI